MSIIHVTVAYYASMRIQFSACIDNSRASAENKG